VGSAERVSGLAFEKISAQVRILGSESGNTVAVVSYTRGDSDAQLEFIEGGDEPRQVKDAAWFLKVRRELQSRWGNLMGWREP